MTEFITETGAKVKIGIASWEDAMELKDAIVSELSLSGMNIDFNNISGSEIDVGQIISSVAKIDASKAVRKALFSCLVKCTYNGEKITSSTFEDPKVRDDYYEIAFACMKENLTPFFKGLLSRLKALGITKLGVIPTLK